MIRVFYKGICFSLCAIDVFSKYAWVISLKDKKGITITNALKKLDEPKRKPIKIWVDKGSELILQYIYKILVKDNDIEAYSTLNKGKSVITERFIRTLKNKMYKTLTSI